MRVLLTQGYLGGKCKEQASFPLGLVYLANSLRSHECTLFDPNVVKRPFVEMEKTIQKTDPEIVGLSLRNIDTAQSHDVFSYFQTFASITKFVKRIKPDAKIVAGGPGFSMFARQIMTKLQEIDYGVFLEGEHSFPELLEKLDHPERVKGIYFRKTEKIFFTGRNKPVNFDQLPVPPKELPNLDIRNYNESSYSIGVQTKRGCCFRCAYCTYPFLQGRDIRLRSPKRVVNEIENLVDFYDIQVVFFADNVFNFPLDHARGIVRELMKRKLKIRWRGWFRESYVNKRFIIEARDSGCDLLEFSPDGASQMALDVLQKDVKIQDIVKAYELANEVADIRVAYNFMCNVPGENFETVADFYKFLFKIVTKSWRKLDWIGLTNIRIYPHTRIHQIAFKEGHINERTDLLTPTFYNPKPFDVAYLPAKWARGPLDKLLETLSGFHYTIG